MIPCRLLIAQGLVGVALLACGPQPAPAPVQPVPVAAPASPRSIVARRTQAAAQADREAVQDAVQLLRQARQAIGEPHGADRATELLERAESRLMTRDMPAAPKARR